MEKLKSYYSKPANLITAIFLVLLLLAVVLPLGTLLVGSFTVNGNQEAIWIGDEAADGDWTFHHWTELLTSQEFDYASTKFWIPLGQSALMALIACGVAVLFGGVVAW
ncbi:MAG: hypothetical protein IJ702_01570, partial [Fretibacterium sp.]|nr:hypothetical protein [Fretibacterium sp.]